MARPKKEKRESSFVTLRTKEVSKGRQSYYLDIYKDGKRSYEFLKLYLLPETSKTAKQQNANTKQAAMAIRNQRELEIIQGKAGIVVDSTNKKILLFDWLETFKAQKEISGQSKSNSVLIGHFIEHLKEYKGNNIKLVDVDEAYCKGFVEYLATAKSLRHIKSERKISSKTGHIYYSYLISALNEAVRKGLIDKNPAKNLSRDEKKPIKLEKRSREFLEIEEVKRLIATECTREDVKQAFLFGCFTGLRLSDIVGLTWDNVTKRNGSYVVSITMQKTREPLVMKLNKQALKYMPKRNGNISVFSLPNNGVTINRVLKEWAKAAGISKNVHFHMSRHTFATMELTLGADLYVVSKLLGHTNVGTTQIYADIINKRRDEAVELIDNAF